MATRGKRFGGFRLLSRLPNPASLSHCPDHSGLTAASHLHHSCIIRSGCPPPPGTGRPSRGLFFFPREPFPRTSRGFRGWGGNSNPKRNLSPSESDGLRFPLKNHFWVLWRRTSHSGGGGGVGGGGGGAAAAAARRRRGGGGRINLFRALPLRGEV